MKWDFKEPKLGDAVRVKLGEIYHYGILIGDDEVIQFGLAPNARQGINPQDIAVCVSNGKDFLQGGFLETGTPEKKDGKLRKPSQVIDYAKSQLGKTGYHILNNNCEHFVYECLFGIKKSLQTDSVREFFASLPIADVYTYQIPKNINFSTVYPPERQKEISSITNLKVKTEKYYAWKLLEYALFRTFGYKISNLTFTKTEKGKWLCDKCYFSISHSHDLVVVAISKKPIGVDCELLEKPKDGAIERVLTKREKKNLSSDGDFKKLLTVWSKKESIFKKSGEGSFYPSKIDTTKYQLAEKTVAVNDKEYIVTTFTDFYKSIRYFENVSLSE